MKILFVQLPLHDHGHSYVQGNVEYAPAAIAAYIGRHVERQVCFEFLPFHLSNFAANNVIARYIAALEPDILSFTTYLWNLERNLRIAALVKGLSPGTKIIFGGPEISPGSHAFDEARSQVDFFVQGEGEWFFRKFLIGADIGRHASIIRGNTLISQPGDELLSSREIVEPFTHGYLNPMGDGGIFLELTRGCPYRCSYCYYSKNCSTVRELPVEVLLRALDRSEFNLKEIYVLSPTFNKSRNFKKNLGLIAARNHGVRLHTEMRSDGIDVALAGAIYAAGFRSLEIGLQTLTPEALDSIGRRSDVQGELSGMRHLKDAGLELKIGIIPGLPGDNPSRFLRTVETLAELGFEENIELYPLMLLPGTRIRDMAESAGASFQGKPPYYLVEGWDFPRDSLAALVNATAGVTGLLQHTDLLPDFTSSDKGILNRGVRIDGRKTERWNASQYGELIETAVFSFHIDLHGSRPEYEAMRKLIAGLPHEDQLYDIILYSDNPLDQEMIISLKDIPGRDSIHHRLNLYSEGKGMSTVRFHQVLSLPDEYSRALDTCYAVTPVLRVDAGNYAMFRDSGLVPERVLVGNHIYPQIKSFLLDNYVDCMENVAFEQVADMEDFYRSLGAEVFTLPDFSIRHID